MAVINWAVENKAVLLGAALAVSECLALIPSIASSGIVDGVIKFLKKLKG